MVTVHEIKDRLSEEKTKVFRKVLMGYSKIPTSDGILWVDHGDLSKIVNDTYPEKSQVFSIIYLLHAVNDMTEDQVKEVLEGDSYVIREEKETD